MANLLKVYSTNESDVEASTDHPQEKRFDYSQRAQWLRGVVLGCNEGVMSSSILVMGMSVFIDNTNDLVITGLMGLIAGALAIATAEYISVYTQIDVVEAQNERDRRSGRVGGGSAPSPTQIGLAASLTYLIGGFVPILTAFFVRHHVLRFIAVAFAACLSMSGAGYFAATLGKAPVLRSCARVLMGGWIEIAIMIGKRKVLECYGL
ncbi:hypothetical protein DCAR_0209194 [Daucus carota subsp. sativus]|uniref:Vacuolar iron transporter n=1 Tax=Daucus carota subsp. sativus TaxID=79200 RepID=A0A161XJ89_DAUCS|nr:PREDICTED: vacuolar iron transporter homolog 4-like [Daucus carota subsp. sativus]WOG89953.1 hypothetical protein DCAR_0209194 [Daucus carota subsp. sativus]